MRFQFLTRELITVENAPPGGGVPIVTLPTDPGAPEMEVTLPVQPSPVQPTPPAGTADEFVFNTPEDTVGSFEELYEYLGLLPDTSEPLLTPIFGSGSFFPGVGFVPDIYVNDRQSLCEIHQSLCDLG